MAKVRVRLPLDALENVSLTERLRYLASNQDRRVRLSHDTLARCSGGGPTASRFRNWTSGHLFRGSNSWWLRLALNQKVAGSIPALGTVAVLHWFRILVVTQVDAGSIPVGHPLLTEIQKWCGMPYGEQPVLETGDCGFESHLHHFWRSLIDIALPAWISLAVDWGSANG